MKTTSYSVSQIPEPPLSRFLFSDTTLAPLWLLLRLYVGWEWTVAGWGKVTNPVWVGPKAGIAVEGFLNGALTKTGGQHPDVALWYAAFINNVAIPNSVTFSYLVAYGELFVGIALILGLFTGIAAFFGSFMNMNYLFAGTVSINPMLFLMHYAYSAWRVAGFGSGSLICRRYSLVQRKNLQKTLQLLPIFFVLTK
jgi:thiosulfate dehydrogenase [quinone] large subunit